MSGHALTIFVLRSQRGTERWLPNDPEHIAETRRQKGRPVNESEGRLDSPHIKTTALKADCTLIEISNVPSVGENTDAISSSGKGKKI